MAARLEGRETNIRGQTETTVCVTVPLEGGNTWRTSSRGGGGGGKRSDRVVVVGFYCRAGKPFYPIKSYGKSADGIGRCLLDI